MQAKPVSEDWTYFNEAVHNRAKALADKKILSDPEPTVMPLATAPTTDSRALWVIAATVAAVALVLLYLALRPVPMGPPGRPGAYGPAGPPGPQGSAAKDGDAALTAPVPEPRKPNIQIMEQVTRFFRVENGSQAVVTGWRFASSNDTAPEYQYCQVYLPSNDLKRTAILIASSKDGVIPYGEGMHPLTKIEHQESLTLCTWVKGMEPRLSE